MSLESIKQGVDNINNADDALILAITAHDTMLGGKDGASRMYGNGLTDEERERNKPLRDIIEKSHSVKRIRSGYAEENERRVAKATLNLSEAIDYQVLEMAALGGIDQQDPRYGFRQRLFATLHAEKAFLVERSKQVLSSDKTTGWNPEVFDDLQAIYRFDPNIKNDLPEIATVMADFRRTCDELSIEDVDDKSVFDLYKEARIAGSKPIGLENLASTAERIRDELLLRNETGIRSCIKASGIEVNSDAVIQAIRDLEFKIVDSESDVGHSMHESRIHKDKSKSSEKYLRKTIIVHMFYAISLAIEGVKKDEGANVKKEPLESRLRLYNTPQCLLEQGYGEIKGFLSEGQFKGGDFYKFILTLEPNVRALWLKTFRDMMLYDLFTKLSKSVLVGTMKMEEARRIMEEEYESRPAQEDGTKAAFDKFWIEFWNHNVIDRMVGYGSYPWTVFQAARAVQGKTEAQIWRLLLDLDGLYDLTTINSLEPGIQ